MVKEIDDEILKTIAEAGANMPSSYNNHNIRVIIVKNSSLIEELSISTVDYLRKTRNQLKTPFVLSLLNKIAPNKTKDIKMLLPSFKALLSQV